MAILAEKIAELRGSRTYVEFAVHTGVNRQTIRDAEAGAPIRLDTLRQIARACDVTEDQWVELLILWIRSAIGDDEFKKLDIRPSSEAMLVDAGSDMRSVLLRLFGSASLAHQSLILEALTAPRIMECVASVTRLFKGRDAVGEDRRDKCNFLESVVTGGSRFLPASQPSLKNLPRRNAGTNKPVKAIRKK